jgi:hypothetical protein
LSVATRRTAALAALLFALTAAPIKLASDLWHGVIGFDPGFAARLARPRDTAAEPALASGVTIVLVDGLRLDTSKNLPFLNELRARGASFDATVGAPSFSRPGRATIATGAWPSLHGVTTNRQRRAMALDNLLRRVADAGRRCRVAGSPIWSGLFRDEIARCGAVRDERTKDGPGTFDRVVPEVRASQEEAFAFVAAGEADLRIVDILSTDFASHEFGGASEQARAEAARADQWIRGLAGGLDFSKGALVVTADHGHIHLDGHGGHGGDEAEVLAVPLVLAGAGIRAGVRGRALHVDVAPTVTALLGLPAPAGAEGRTLVEALSLTGEAAGRLRAADESRHAAIAQEISMSLDASERPTATGGDWRAGLLEATRAARRPLVGMAGIVIGALVAVTLLLVDGPDRVRVVGGAVLALLVGAAAIALLSEPISLSTINYDEQVAAFFGRIAAIVGVSALVSTGVAVAPFAPASRTRTALAIGVLVGLVLLGAYLFAWGRDGLLAPRFLPEVGALTPAFVLLIARAAFGVAVFAGAAAAAFAVRRAAAVDPRK